MPGSLDASDARSGAHKGERRRWSRHLEHGGSVQCSCTGHCGKHEGRCTVIIMHGSAWDLGHTEDRSDWTGPECVPCNRSAGAINSNAGGMTVRSWP